MRIGFLWTRGGPDKWDGRDLEKGIGGSENMMILYAQEFAREHGVFCQSPCEGIFHQGVHWRAEIPKDLDFVVSVRTPAPLYDFEKVRTRAILCNDQTCPDLTKAVDEGACNLIITISRHQTDRYQHLYPEIPKAIYLTSSAGVDWLSYQTSSIQKDPFRCLYTSTQERGLRYLVEMWPMIHDEFPEAELIVTGGYQLYGWSDEQARKASGDIYEQVDEMDGAHYVGVLPRSSLQALQLSSSLLLYPTTYEEMCCIAALEASSAGMAIISSPIGAMPERVSEHSGILIEGNPATESYQERFIEAACTLLDNRPLTFAMGTTGRMMAYNYRYEALCQQWLERIYA